MISFNGDDRGADLTPQSKSVTALLNAWGSGDQAAGNELVEIVYKELRRLAAHYLQSERPDHTLQPTALVHELYLKLFSAEPIEWQNRGHFLAVAARQLRHIVVDYARNQRAQKRGGPLGKISIEDAPQIGVVVDSRVVDLDRALERLAQLDARAAQVVEFRYFGGLTESETGEALDISVATVKRDWDFARSWLLKEME
jgi:RNA polymerase sigma factor (TIGR02999 family)